MGKTILLSIALALPGIGVANADPLPLKWQQVVSQASIWRSETCASSMLHPEVKQMLCAPWWRTQSIMVVRAVNGSESDGQSDLYSLASNQPVDGLQPVNK
jgi:hypothetical protein